MLMRLWDRRRKWLRQGLGVLAVVACLLTAISCAGTTDRSRSGYFRQMSPTRRSGEVLLEPKFQAGEGGWCVTTLSVGASACQTFRLPTFQGPIIVESWSGESSSSTTPVDRAVVLTTGKVATVALAGYRPVPTQTGTGLPDHLRAAVVEIRGSSERSVLGVATPAPFPGSHFAALNSRGDEIPQSRLPGPPLEFQVPSRSWKRPEHMPSGVCSLSVRAATGILLEGGGVMMAVRPHPDIRGREFVDCVRASYLVDNWPLEVNVLLDAAHPGALPASLPAMRPVARHPGVFQGPGVEGEMVARRIRRAWVIVAKGEGFMQRLKMLERIDVTTRLG